jgi:polyphosphate glucokinase
VNVGYNIRRVLFSREKAYMDVFGLDIGGSGIKGAPVNAESGELVGERIRVPTPEAAMPDEVVAAAVEVVSRSGWDGPVGCGFPGVVKGGVIHTAANVADEFIGFDLQTRLQKELGAPVRIVNDADAAGLAEMRWGAGRGVEGVVLMLTLGTGIGTALFIEGKLVPNTELGHIEIHGREAELWAADRIRKVEELSWKKWSKRIGEYFQKMEALFWPDLIIVGGGVSKKSERFLPRIETRTKVVPATMLNAAGIAGAALAYVPETPVTPQPPAATRA